MISLDFLHDNLKQTYDCFRKVLTDKNFDVVSSYLGWKGYEKGISKLFYVNDYVKLISQRQFSCILKENNGIDNQDIKGAIQIVYEFNVDTLTKVRLAFYPKPIIIEAHNIDNDSFIDTNSEEELQNIYHILSELIGISFDFTNTTHIRIDYDADVESHSKIHLQISGINELRLPMYFIPLPFHFIDFLTKHLLPLEYKQIIGKEPYISLKSRSNGKIEKFDNDKSKETSLFIDM
jgi:hypothetical protein